MKNEVMPNILYFLVTETEDIEFDNLAEVYEYITEFELVTGEYCIYKGYLVL